MRRLARWLFTLCSVVSLVLCVGSLALGLRGAVRPTSYLLAVEGDERYARELFLGLNGGRLTLFELRKS